MTHECKNWEGRIRYEQEIIDKIPYKERLGFVQRNAEYMKRTFCERLCPVGRWYRRIEKGLDVKLDAIRKEITCWTKDAL